MKKFKSSGIATITKVFIFSLLFISFPSEGQTINWRAALSQEPDWYSGSEAIRIADNVILYQHETGGWPKNINMAKVLSEEEKEEIRQNKARGGGNLNNPTIDNHATYTQMRYLARVYEATGQERFKEGFLKGVDYLLEAQYDNGGWPQYYPLRTGYHNFITYNDGAIVGVMRVLREIEKEEAPYDFIDDHYIKIIRQAIEKGTQAILKTQIEVDGELTAWCAQHHPETLEPALGRSYELPSISGGESVGVVRYLMTIEEPSPEVINSIKSAVRWFEKVKMTDIRLVRKEDPSLPRGFDRIVALDPVGDSPMWARFYEIGTNYPIFSGRDGVKQYALSEIEHERRIGYSWLGTWAKNLLEVDYPEWCKKHGIEETIF